MDAIYELYTGDYIDLSNLVLVSKIYFYDSSLGREPEKESWGRVVFRCKFRLLKDTVDIGDNKNVTGEKEIEEKKKFVERERQELISAWNLYRKSERE
jgi:hypothetical protein